MIRYLFLVNLFGLFFWLIYRLFLNGRSDLHLSRFFLLAAVLGACVFPLISLPHGLISSMAPTSSSFFEYIQTLPALVLDGKQDTDFASGRLLSFQTIYGLIVLILLIRILILHVLLNHKISKLGTPVWQNGIRIFYHSKIGPGSYYRTIFAPDDTLEPAILRHEMAHIQLRHYRDRLYFQIMKALFFPAIPFYFLAKEATLVREFQADEVAAQDKDDYLSLLLNGYHLALKPNYLEFFFQHPLKRRIMMLSKSKQSVKKYIFLPATILGIGLLIAGQSEISFAQNSPSAQAQKTTDDDEIVQFVDEPAQFPGGFDSLYQWLGKNIKYPDVKKQDRKEGIVRVQFIVNRDGTASNFSVIDGGGLSSDYDKAVLDAFQKFPKWTPAKKDGASVKSYFILPVQFTKQD